MLPLAWMWQDSRMPGEYSIMDMGYVDTGGGPDTMAAVVTPAHEMVSVADLVEDTDRPADVVVELTARARSG